MFMYHYYCPKCGHNKACPTKIDWSIEKKEHKRGGCPLMFAPHKDFFILARPQLAEEARKGRDFAFEELVREEESLNIESKNSKTTSSS